MLRGSERVTRYRVGMLRSRRRVNHDSSRFFGLPSPATRTPTPRGSLDRSMFASMKCRDMSSMRMWMSEGYGEGRKSWYERVRVVAEVDEFVMRVCLLALEDATGVKASFLAQTPAIIELSIGYYLKGKEIEIDALLEQVATVKKKARPKNLDVS